MSLWHATKTRGSARALFASVSACLLVAASLGCGDGRLRTFIAPADGAQPAETLAPAHTPATSPSPEHAPDNATTGGPPPRLLPSPPGTPEPVPQGSSSESLLIDDLEDGDAELAQPLHGSWYSFDDQSGSQSTHIDEPDEKRVGSLYSLHTAGEGFRDWGAGVGAPLLRDAKLEQAGLDASAYDAVTFWARADKGSERRLYVQLQNPDRDGDLEPERFEAKVTLSNEWEQYVVSFEQLEQPEDAAHLSEPLDLTRLTALQFFFPYPDGFDVWLDDITFSVDCRYCETHLHHVSSEPPDQPGAEGSPLGH